jgi:inhibitor of KinA sporulation pathway (predicted exonuclease)
LDQWINLPATVLDGAPTEVRVEIFQPEPIRPVMQPGMSDCLPFTEITQSAVGIFEICSSLGEVEQRTWDKNVFHSPVEQRSREQTVTDEKSLIVNAFASRRA